MVGKIGHHKLGVKLLCGVLLGVGASPTMGQSGPSADPVERVSWQGKIATASRLEVSNPYGDLRLRYGGADRTVEVTVALQQIDLPDFRLELKVDETSDPATVRIVRTATGGQMPGDSKSGLGRADMVVLVPAGLAILARTDRGLAESSGLESDLELETVSGPIRVRSTSGSVQARSGRGEISVVLLAGVTKAPQRLSSDTGSIEVWVGDSSSLKVTLATSGRLISDYSMEVEHRDLEEPDKIAGVTVGDGGSPLEITSLRGDVSLRRLMNPDRHVVAPVDDGTPR